MAFYTEKVTKQTKNSIDCSLEMEGGYFEDTGENRKN
jgi:hypothetical protein